MRLWVTRPRPDAEALARLLAERGHETVIEPLLDLVWMPATAPFSAVGVQAVIATSRNAIRGLAALRADGAGVGKAAPATIAELSGLPLFAVGPGTASEARAAGWTSVVEGPGRACDLAALVSAECEATDGALLVLRGREIAFDLASELVRAGFDVREETLYATVPGDAPSNVLAAEIRAGRVDGVILLSPKTAALYGERMVERGLADAALRLRHYCLSPAVAAELRALEGVVPLVSAKPNLPEMLGLVG